MTREMLIVLVTGVVAAAATFVSTCLLQKFSRRRQLRQLVTALDFEVEANKESATRIFESLNYLRDEAFVKLKNDGYIGYLPPQVRQMIACVYDRMYALNHRVEAARELPTDAREQCTAQYGPQLREVITDSEELLREIRKTCKPWVEPEK